MPTQRPRLWRLMLTVGLLVSVASAAQVFADSASSSSYSVDQTQFGSGSQLNGCSTSYCSDAAAGDTAVGSTRSTNYSAQIGSNTSDTPLLEVTAAGGIQNLGILDTSGTGTATATVNVRSYLSDGYTIQITGSSPTQGTHALTTLTTPASSHAGAEQFGINLVANSTPAIGADPIQQPSGTFSTGVVTSDYANPNLFKYVDGDIVAESSISTGETDYTISMILNVSNVTPGGHYNGTFSAVVVPLY